MNSGRKSQQKSASRRIELRRGQLKNGNPSGDYMKAPRCGARLHGGKSTGAKTKAGLQRIRAVHWKDGSRSERLIAEGRVLAAKKQREIFNQLTKNYDAVTIYVHQLLGWPAFPTVKVRAELRYPEGPPPEWAEEREKK
jgi:hypothetical protein